MIVNDSRQQLIDEHGCLMINDTIQAELDYNEKVKFDFLQNAKQSFIFEKFKILKSLLQRENLIILQECL